MCSTLIGLFLLGLFFNARSDSVFEYNATNLVNLSVPAGWSFVGNTACWNNNNTAIVRFHALGAWSVDFEFGSAKRIVVGVSLTNQTNGFVRVDYTTTLGPKLNSGGPPVYAGISISDYITYSSVPRGNLSLLRTDFCILFRCAAHVCAYGWYRYPSIATFGYGESCSNEFQGYTYWPTYNSTWNLNGSSGTGSGSGGLFRYAFELRPSLPFPVGQDPYTPLSCYTNPDNCTFSNANGNCVFYYISIPAPVFVGGTAIPFLGGCLRSPTYYLTGIEDMVSSFDLTNQLNCSITSNTCGSVIDNYLYFVTPPNYCGLYSCNAGAQYLETVTCVDDPPVGTPQVVAITRYITAPVTCLGTDIDGPNITCALKTWGAGVTVAGGTAPTAYATLPNCQFFFNYNTSGGGPGALIGSTQATCVYCVGTCDSSDPVAIITANVGNSLSVGGTRTCNEDVFCSPSVPFGSTGGGAVNCTTLTTTFGTLNGTTLTFPPNWFGTVTVTAYCFQPNGNERTGSYTVNVNPVNDGPLCTYNFTTPEIMNFTCTDPEGDNIYVSFGSTSLTGVVSLLYISGINATDPYKANGSSLVGGQLPSGGYVVLTIVGDESGIVELNFYARDTDAVDGTPRANSVTALFSASTNITVEVTESSSDVSTNDLLITGGVALGVIIILVSVVYTCFSCVCRSSNKKTT